MENKENIQSVEITAVKPDYTAEISAILHSNAAPKALMNQLEDYHANDIAEALEALSERERKKFYRISSVEMLAEIFEFFDEEDAGVYLNEMDIRKAAAVVSKLDTDTAVETLRTIGKEKRSLIIEAVEPDVQKEIKLIASFDEDEIGSRMTTNCIIIRENMSVKEAMKELIRQAEENDNIATLFVTDESGGFNGAIDLKDLITARSEKPLTSLIAASFPYVYANEQTAD